MRVGVEGEACAYFLRVSAFSAVMKASLPCHAASVRPYIATEG